ncbi:dynamin family protein [Bacillus timonensis]|nr:dynamin family protein [Bacillus timonensis]
MGHTKLNITLTKQQVLNKLVFLYNEISSKKDKDNTKKLLQLIKKVNQSEYAIGFCGHFSAGKSSMINELIGNDILPSSPIPTSANLVKVKTGREYVRVYYKNGEIIEYQPPCDYSEIKNYCKNGEDIESLEISQSNGKLPLGVSIMDTPGIDSTDDAHRISTESALHLADCIFYIMDYNHVQSELNFQFTKDLIDRKKTLYLVVNQIDKHNKEELSIEEFQQSVVNAFKNWNVEPKKIFYTSLRQEMNTFNQLNELRDLITQLIEEKDQFLLESALISAEQIISDHLVFIEDSQATEIEEYEEVLSEIPTEDFKELQEKIEEVENKLAELNQKESNFKHSFFTKLNNILENAYLMPFSTRELAKALLEAYQSDFKVGMFFSKGKTEKEKQKRLNEFYQEVKKNSSTQIEWHINDFLAKFLKENELQDLLAKAQKLNFDFPPNLLVRTIKSGAGLTGDYILTYTNDVAAEIKKHFKLVISEFLDEGLNMLKAENDVVTSKLSHQLQKLEKIKFAHTKLEELVTHRKDVKLELESALLDELPHVKNVNEIISVATTESISIETIQHDKINSREDLKNQPVEDPSLLSSNKEIFTEERLNTIINNLEIAKEKTKSITGLSSISKIMGEKAGRLRNRQFTIALFGAFSAGKSSFANALMGEKVLPVSPNPTTATINKIVPPTNKHAHGTVLVKLKSSSDLLSDIQHSLQVFGEKSTSLNDARDIIQTKLLEKGVEAHEKPHLSFLTAFVKGMESLQGHLGQVLSVDLNEYEEFVAKEEKACFVEWIELYFDCELTRQGITLVDTPGADSINARHTGVAFDYIKDADAILFVTYYNHPFSKADREFLIQLGRVKDSFSLDKMFFIINAADLARSLDELQMVEQYVNDQLNSYGIRKPRLHSLSSQMAIMEKFKGDNNNSGTGVLTSSGIKEFEEEFNKFVLGELTEMTVLSAINDMKRASSVVKDMVTTANQSIEYKQEKLKTVVDEEKQIIHAINNFNADVEHHALLQEIEELVYYINQRIFLRFPDFFKESFNPAILRDDNQNIKKALVGCLNELLSFMGYDLAQEMRATSLRVEKFINQKGIDIQEKWKRLATLTNPNLNFEQYENIKMDTPMFETGLQDIDLNLFKKSLSMYKNAKSFFERNEKKKMSEDLERIIQSQVMDYLKENTQKLTDRYEDEFNSMVDSLKNRSIVQIEEYYSGIKNALTAEVDVDSLNEVYMTLNNMEAELNE